MPAILVNSLNFIETASWAAKGVKQHRLSSNQTKAQISVIFAAASLEAFINETADWARQVSNFSSQPDRIMTLAQVLTDAEKSRASVQAKYQLVHWILFSKAYEQGSNPYQDFALLMELRNSLMHIKPRPAVISRLESRGLFPNLTDQDFTQFSGFWTMAISTKQIANWSCHSAASFAVDFLSKVEKDVLDQLNAAENPVSLFWTGQKREWEAALKNHPHQHNNR